MFELCKFLFLRDISEVEAEQKMLEEVCYPKFHKFVAYYVEKF